MKWTVTRLKTAVPQILTSWSPAPLRDGRFHPWRTSVCAGHHAAMDADSSRPAPTLIRVVVVDDHPAMRAGIAAVLDAAPDLQFVGEASEANELWPVLTRTDPDVVLVDFHLPDEDGLLLCHRIKRMAPAPRVVVNSAYADESLVAPAMLAQADALVAKHASSAVLCETLRDVVREPRPASQLAPELRERLVALLEPDEVALVGLLLLRTPTDELMRTTGLTGQQFDERVERLLRRISSAHGLPV